MSIRTAAVALLPALSTNALAAPPTVIYSEIPGHPTAQAPGLGIDFTGFLSLYTSPNGRHWIFKAFVDDPENDVIVAGSGMTGAVVAREADPTPIDGTTHNFLDSDCGINDSGVFAYGSRLDGVASNADEIIFSGSTIVAREGVLAPGLFDLGLVGDEVFGNSLNSPSVLADGTVCFRADLIENVDNDFESALYIGSTVAAQEGTTAETGEVYDSFAAFSGNFFSLTPDGAHWVVESDIDPSPFSSTEAVVVDDAVVLRQGDTLLPTSAIVDAVFSVEMAPNGDWYARGDFIDDTDWVVRNGVVIAHTGGAVDDADFENWSDVISGVTGDANGNYLVAGETDNPNPDLNAVLSLNGSQIIAREGDPVDLDGNGLADDGVEINAFSPEDIAFVDDGSVLAFVTLRQTGGPGANLGDAFIRITPGPTPCNEADLAIPFGALDFSDVVAFLAAFAAMDPAADLAPPEGLFDFSDVVAFLAAFGAGCP